MSDRMSSAIRTLQKAGFTGDRLRTAFAIVMRESGGNPAAHNTNTGTGDNSYGLAQINMLGGLGPSRRKQFGISSDAQLLDPATNARAMYALSKGGRDFGAWGIGPNAYRTGAGQDTIAKFYNEFPGAPSSPGNSPPAAQPSRAPGGTPDPRLALALLALSRSRRGGGGSSFLEALAAGAPQAQAPSPPQPIGNPGDSGEAAALAQGKYPVSFFRRPYRPLGTPHQGTHTLGNWQSDNAYDYGEPAGTPIFTPFPATVGPVKPGASSGRFGGYAVYLKGPKGRIYLKHLAPNVKVKPGQKVKAGTLIGYVGNIPGLSPHLHAGFER